MSYYESSKMFVLPDCEKSRLITFEYIENFIISFNVNCTANICFNNISIIGKIAENYENDKKKYKIKIMNLFLGVNSRCMHDNEIFLDWFGKCLFHNNTSYEIVIKSDKELTDKNAIYLFRVNDYINDTLYCHSL